MTTCKKMADSSTWSCYRQNRTWVQRKQYLVEDKTGLCWR